MRVLLVPSLRFEGWKAMDRYADSLVRHLHDVLPPGWTLSVQSDPHMPAWTRFGTRWLLYPRLIDWRAFDVVHVLDQSYAHVLYRRPPGVRAVLTAHDLYALDGGRGRTGVRAALVRRIDAWVLRAIGRADVVLCDSSATRDALIRWDPSLGPRARLEFLAVADEFFLEDPGQARTHGRQRLGIPSEAFVVLHVGSCVPRKNVGAVLAAVQDLRSTVPSIIFLQVGGIFSNEHRRELRARGLTQVVRQMTNVPEEVLPLIYGSADVVVVPSLFEGFGFPVLESFAAGTPVACSRNWSLKDFPDDLIESAGAGSAAEIATAVANIWRAPGLAASRAAKARGWARQWTWHRVATGAARAYGAPV